MRKRLSIIVPLFATLFFQFLYSTSLDHGSFKTGSWSFYDGDYARGSVLVKGTAFFPYNGSVTLSIYTGGFHNIHSNNSTIILKNDLNISGFFLDPVTSNTFSISGENHNIFLQENQVLNKFKISANDLIINCADKSISLNSNYALQVAEDSTLHLKKSVLYVNYPLGLFLKSEGSKIILEDCTLILSDDCFIDKGTVEFRGNVFVNSDSSKSLILTGSNHTVKANSVLTIESGAKLDLMSSGTNDQFLTFEDDTAQLVLDGSILNINENLRDILVGGNLVIKGEVDFNITSTAESFASEMSELRDPSLDFGNVVHIRASNWSPCGKYLAVVGDDGVASPDGTGYTGVYYYNDGVLSLVTSVEHANKSYWYTVAWSPDGKYVAAGGGGVSGYDKVLAIYSFDGLSLTEVADADWTGSGPFVYDVSWHPSGDYIAAGGKDYGVGEQGFAVYAFDGSRLTLKGTKIGTSVRTLAWDPFGEYLAIGSATDPVELEIYEFDVSTETLNTTAVVTVDLTPDMNIVRWRYDGAYLGVGDTSGNIYIYLFNRVTPSLTQEFTKDVGTRIDGLAWSPDGNYVAFTECANFFEVDTFYINDAGDIGLSYIYGATFNDTVDVNTVAWHPSGNPLAVGALVGGVGAELKLFNFRETIFEEEVGARIEFGQEAKTSAWSKDGNLFAVAGLDDSGNKELHIYEFDGSNLIFTYSIENAFDEIYSLDWSYTGSYLAVGANQSANKELMVYKYEDNELQLTSSLDLDNDVFVVEWSPDFLAVMAGGFNIIDTDKDIVIYDFSNETLDTVLCANGEWSFRGTRVFKWEATGTYAIAFNAYYLYIHEYDADWVRTITASVIPVDGSTYMNDAAWSPDGNYVVAGVENGEIYVYAFDGSSLTEKDTVDIGTEVYSVDWINNFIVVGCDPDASNEQVQVYEFDSVTETISLLGNTKKDFNGIVNKVEWHPSGDYMSVVGAGSPDVQVYDFNGVMLSVIPDAQITFSSSLYTHFDISPNGNYIAVAYYKSADDKKLQLYDVSNASNGEITFLSDVDISDSPYYVSWSPNGKYVAVGGAGGYLNIYQLNGNIFSQVVDQTIGTGADNLLVVTWSPDGKYIAMGMSNEDNGYGVFLYRFNGTSITYKHIIDFGNDVIYIYAVDWSSNGDYIAVGGSGFDSGNEVEVYGFTKSTEQFTALIDGAAIGSVQCLHWNPDGEYLAVGQYGGDENTRLYHFNGTTLTFKGTVENSGHDTGAVRWDPSGRFLITGEEDDAVPNVCDYFLHEFNRADEILDLIPNSKISDYGVANAFDITTVCWFPDGDKIAIMGRRNNDLQIFNFAGRPLQQASEMNVDQAGSSYVESIKWSPSGNYLAVGMYQGASVGVNVYKFDSNNTLELLHGTQIDYGSAVYAVDWSPDENFLAVGGNTPDNDHELQVYRFNRQSSLCLTTSVDLGSEGGISIQALAWSPDGNHLAVGGDTLTNSELQIYTMSQEDHFDNIIYCTGANYGICVEEIAWSSDGNYLTVVGNGSISGDELEVYSFNSITSVLTLKDGVDIGNNIRDVAWSGTGNYIAIGAQVPTETDGELQVYYFNGTSLEFKDRVNFSDTDGKVRAVDWSPDSNYIAIGGQDGVDDYEIKIYYFNGSSLSLASQVDYGDASLAGALSVHWSPDGNFLAAGGYTPNDTKDIKVYPIAFDTTYSFTVSESSTMPVIGISDATINASKGLTIENIKLRVR
jgi:WD40 repeat protein